MSQPSSIKSFASFTKDIELLTSNTIFIDQDHLAFIIVYYRVILLSSVLIYMFYKYLIHIMLKIVIDLNFNGSVNYIFFLAAFDNFSTFCLSIFFNTYPLFIKFLSESINFSSLSFIYFLFEAHSFFYSSFQCSLSLY